MYEWIGLTGSILIVISWIPEIVRLIKTKKTEGISLNFLFVILLGSALLAIYSAYIKNNIFLWLNTLAVANTLTVILLILMYRKH